MIHRSGRLAVYDGPGTTKEYSENVIENSSILRHGLSYEPVNAILVVVQFHPRVSEMIKSCAQTMSVLKK